MTYFDYFYSVCQHAQLLRQMNTQIKIDRHYSGAANYCKLRTGPQAGPCFTVAAAAGICKVRQGQERFKPSLLSVPLRPLRLVSTFRLHTQHSEKG